MTQMTMTQMMVTMIMNKYVLSFLFLINSPLFGCSMCLHTMSRDKDSGTYQSHSVSHKDKCLCKCNQKRTDDGTCIECGHKVMQQKLKIIKDNKEETSEQKNSSSISQNILKRLFQFLTDKKSNS